MVLSQARRNGIRVSQPDKRAPQWPELYQPIIVQGTHGGGRDGIPWFRLDVTGVMHTQANVSLPFGHLSLSTSR